MHVRTALMEVVVNIKKTHTHTHTHTPHVVCAHNATEKISCVEATHTFVQAGTPSYPFNRGRSAFESAVDFRVGVRGFRVGARESSGA